MDLYLVRHAIAEQRDAGRWPEDALRPLSERGRRRFQPAARGLARIAPPIDLVLCSPATRARETAEILQARAGWPAPSIEAGLAPDSSASAALRAIVSRTLSMDVVPQHLGVVGHEPTLSTLAGLLCGSFGLQTDWRKGGVALIRTAGQPARQNGRLRWLLPPRLLRSLR